MTEAEKEDELVVNSILSLIDTEKREEALNELSKRKETYSSLAPILWHSFGTIAIL